MVASNSSFPQGMVFSSFCIQMSIFFHRPTQFFHFAVCVAIVFQPGRGIDSYCSSLNQLGQGV